MSCSLVLQKSITKRLFVFTQTGLSVTKFRLSFGKIGLFHNTLSTDAKFRVHRKGSTYMRTVRELLD